jgi:hypothetical protein
VSKKISSEELADLALRIKRGELIHPSEYPLLLQAISAAWHDRDEARATTDRIMREWDDVNDEHEDEMNQALKQRDEARTIACKLLYIAEHRGPNVFGPRPPWLKPDPDG